ncbi:GmrSD restriction endonuclease domain-containing protein [Lysinibacillus sp. NPDC094403]|uniref:GmrSD restriction endonuclease domain-containing protein n=1 Tax=Lysinibacillus sp. NPDC094403 TaxID=3390581 RepID=UPI003CFEA2CA
MNVLTENNLKILNGKTITLGQLIDGIKNELSKNSDSKVFIPMYQRNYKWNKEIAVKLIKELIASFTSSTTKSIALFTLYIDRKNNIQIVDGQQRMITLLLVFQALEISSEFVQLEFERDFTLRIGSKRSFFIKNIENSNFVEHSLTKKRAKSDKRRLVYNYSGIKEVVEKFKNEGNDIEGFKAFLRDNVQLLLHVTSDAPVSEFLNLNCNKTRFSVCDRVRSELMIFYSLNSNKLSSEEINVLDETLEHSDYKFAISDLFEQLTELVYTDGVYNTIQLGYNDPDKTKENRINTMFSSYLIDNSKEYIHFEIPTNKFQIDLLKQMMVYKSVLNELNQNLQNNYQATQKAYQTLYMYNPNVRFFELINKHIDKINSNNLLSEILHLECSIDKIIFDYVKDNVNGKDVYFFNSYFDALSNNDPDIQNSSLLKKQFENAKSNHYFPMDKFYFEDIIHGSGKYILNRYVNEHQNETDKFLMLMPINYLTEETKKKIDESIISIGKSVTTRELLCETNREIIIPAIQRDYCMGSHFGLSNESDLLDFMIGEFKKTREKDITLSAITIFQPAKNKISIYDGQQRIFTLACIIRTLDVDEVENKILLCHFDFEHRTRMNSFCEKFFKENPSNLKDKSYAENSIINLQKELKNKLKGTEYNEFKNYILDKVRVDVITVDTSLSEAEQFFIDINNGVQLVPYEIFKCKINDRFSKCYPAGLELKPEDNWISMIDNEWLDFFYELNSTKLDNEDAIDELVEMRFIEYCCRMIYWEKYIKDGSRKKHPIELKGFNKSQNAKELGDCEKFIDCLEFEDFIRISKIMNSFRSNYKKNKQFSEQIKFEGELYNEGTVVHCIPYFGIENYNDSSRNYYLTKFIEGLVVKEKKYEQKYQEDRSRDIVIWAILNDFVGQNITGRDVMKKWNESEIKCTPYAYITSTFIGKYKKTILPIPEYYYNHEEYENIFENTLKNEVNIKKQMRDLYDNIMRNYLGLPELYIPSIDDNNSVSNQFNLFYRYKGSKFTKYKVPILKLDHEDYYIAFAKGSRKLFKIYVETGNTIVTFEPLDTFNFYKQ